jgi:hypothetical protein
MKFADALLSHKDTRHQRSGCSQNLTKCQTKANTEMAKEEKGQLREEKER